MRILTIGDPHVMISNLEDSGKLLNFIYKAAKKYDVELIEFTGDLFHNHAVLRQEIINFWRTKLDLLSGLNIPIILVAGNHDQVGDKSHEGDFSALDTLDNIKNIMIVNNYLIYEQKGIKLGYLAYTRNHDKFIKNAQEMHERGVNRLLAHQTFTGVKYDNGFYAPDGIDPSLIRQDFLVSGHIHSHSQVGKCFYVGAPKADNMSDANLDKFIWLSDYDGKKLEYTPISTEGIVTTYKKYVIKEGEEIPTLNPEHKNYLELVGKNTWITKIKKELKKTENIQIKAVPTDTKTTTPVKNLETIDKFLMTFKPQHGILLQEIEEYLRSVSE